MQLYCPRAKLARLSAGVKCPCFLAAPDKAGSQAPLASRHSYTPAIHRHGEERAGQSITASLRVGRSRRATTGAAVTASAFNILTRTPATIVVGAAVFVPYGGQSRNEVGARTTFQGNFVAGYYFTPHDRMPCGDLVGYVSANLYQLTEGPGSKATTLTLAPGFRTHLGSDWYLLGASKSR
jgi:hypothetical protein